MKPVFFGIEQTEPNHLFVIVDGPSDEANREQTEVD